MSAIRRLTQEYRSASDSPATPATPRRSRPSNLYRSPASTPSISHSVPFDWEAARSHKATPLRTPRKSAPGTPRRAVVKKQSFIEKWTSLPARIAFELSIFPDNVPLPKRQTLAWFAGGSMHFLHFCARLSQSSRVPDSELGWEDMYSEDGQSSWFDWTVLVSALLVSLSVLNALYLFTRVKLYNLHKQKDPVSSPNARFVDSNLDREMLEPPSMISQILYASRHAFTVSWRFLLGIEAPAKRLNPSDTSRVQQLEVWNPGHLELTLFTVYSPCHALLWLATGSSNWMLMWLVMIIVGVQLNVFMQSFQALIKDKEIIAAEVLNEYNQVFVYPRVHPVKTDVAVMTHQSEMVNIWED